MQYIMETPLRNFDFDQRSEENAFTFTDEDLDALDIYLSTFNKLFTEDEINDMFVNNLDELARQIGYDSFKEVQDEAW